MERWIRSLLVMFIFVALATQAQHANKKGGKARGGGKNFMQQADANGDGEIDEAEAEQFAKVRAARLKKQVATIVQKFDADGDGTLGEDEIAKMKNEVGARGGKDPTRFLKHVDKDGDFRISDEEEAAAVKTFVAQARKAGKAQGGKQGAQKARARPKQVDPDTNGDGIVDEEEARIAAERRVEMARKQLETFKQRQAQNPAVKMPWFMAMVDTNKDGELNGEETNALIEQVMQEFEKRNELVLKIFDDNQDGVLDDVEQVAVKKAFLYVKETQKVNAERMRKINELRGGKQPAKRGGGQAGKARAKRKKKGGDQ